MVRVPNSISLWRKKARYEEIVRNFYRVSGYEACSKFHTIDIRWFQKSARIGREAGAASLESPDILMTVAITRNPLQRDALEVPKWPVVLQNSLWYNVCAMGKHPTSGLQPQNCPRNYCHNHRHCHRHRDHCHYHRNHRCIVIVIVMKSILRANWQKAIVTYRAYHVIQKSLFFCHVDQLASVIMSSRHHVISSSWHHVIISSHHHVVMSSCHRVII